MFYNRKSRRIESLPTDEGDKPRYRVRLMSNQIAPNTQSLLARLVKSKPQFFATPDRKSTRLNSSHLKLSRMPSSA